MTRWCSKAKAVAADRDVTSILVKMLDRWRDDGLLAEDELGGDLLVGHPGGDEPQDLDLAVGEPGGEVGRRAGDVAQVAEVERARRAARTARRRLRTTRRRRRRRRPRGTPRLQHACRRHLVGDAELLPALAPRAAASPHAERSPDASWTRPRVDSAAAASAGLCEVGRDRLELRRGRGRRRRGRRRRSAIWARAGSSRARPRRSQVISSRARVMIATAASTFALGEAQERESRTAADRVSSSAWRNASSAPSRSPSRRRISPISA